MIPVANTAELEAAVAEGQAGDVIVLAGASYAPESTLQIRRDLTIRGPITGTGAKIIGSNIASGVQTDLFVIDAGATATLSNVTLSQTGPDGAAISSFGSVAIDHSTISGNAAFGIVAQSSSALTAVNATITDNADAGVVAQPGAQVTLTNTTIAGNRRGLHNEPGSVVRLRNTILANPDGDCLNAVQGSIASIERSTGGCSANVQADAVVERPAENGGPTVTRAPVAGSPAIDAGDPATCPTDDQRYSARVGRCDIGAFEVGGVPGTASPSAAPPGSATPSCARGDRAASRIARLSVVARGSIGRTRVRRATFGLTMRSGKATKVGTYIDRTAGVAIRLSLTSVVKRPGRNVTLRGLGRDITGGGIRCVTIELRDGRPDRFAIRLSGGYSRRGVLHSGAVRISAK